MNRSYKYYDLARLKFHATGFLVQLHKSEFIFHLGLEDKRYPLQIEWKALTFNSIRFLSD